jgi:hypothetical protein
VPFTDGPEDLEAVLARYALWGACTREALLTASPAHLLDDVTALPALVAQLSGERAAPG